MDRKIHFLTENFQKDGSDGVVEGVTVLLDGMLLEILETFKALNPTYTNNTAIIQDALMRGLEDIRDELTHK